MPGLISNTRASIRKALGSVSGYIQITVIGILLVFTFMFTRSPSEEDVIARGALRATTTEDSAEVSVTRPVAQTSTPVISATGSMVVRSYVPLASQVGGRIVFVSEALRTGGNFSSGQQLMAIDATDFQLSLAQAQADVSSAEATLKLRIAEGDVAVENYALLHGDDKAPPLVAREPQIDQAKAQLAAAQARQKIAQLALDRTRFSLPFSGYVTEASIEVGQMVAAGQSFGRAFSEDAVEALVPLSSRELAVIAPAPGRRATVSVGGVRHGAVVNRISAELDGQTRFASAYLKIDDERLISPGTFVDVSLEGMPMANSYVLPETTRQINDSLWLVANGVLQRFQPNIYATTDAGMVVEAFDYKDGIVVGSPPGARDGLPVNVATAQP
jgi:RND family efflux transporter MFP subunit